MTVVQNDG